MNNDIISKVREGYEAFAHGDPQPILGLLAPDVTWGMIGLEEDAPFLGIRKGVEGAVSMLQSVGETQELHRFEPHGYYASGDKVFVPGVAKWTMRRNGVPGENEWVHVMTVKDGRIVSFRGYTDTAALARAYHAEPVTKRAAAR